MNNIIAIVAVTVAIGAIDVARHDSRDSMELNRQFRAVQTVKTSPDHWRVSPYSDLGHLSPYVGADAKEWSPHDND